MSIITCWAVKGGSGTTVVAAGLALAAPKGVLVDLAGELPAALGIAEPAGQGLAEWLASDAPPSAIIELAVDVDADRQISVVPRGAGDLPGSSERWTDLAAWMAGDRRTFVVDAGTGVPPAPLTSGAHDDGVRDLLVTRPCYLSLRRIGRHAARPSGVVLLAERHRSLGARDVAQCVGAPVVAQVPLDPAIARAVDAGLLAGRVPSSLTKPLRAVRERRDARVDVVTTTP
jgi:hypothetical protein